MMIVIAIITRMLLSSLIPYLAFALASILGRIQIVNLFFNLAKKRLKVRLINLGSNSIKLNLKSLALLSVLHL